jgi:hypothetical protein
MSMVPILPLQESADIRHNIAQACQAQSRTSEYLRTVESPTNASEHQRRCVARPRCPKARADLLAAMTANMRPKIVIVVDPDIDVPRNANGPLQVAFMLKRGLRLPLAAGARHDRGRCAARRHARSLGRPLAAARPADRIGGGDRRDVSVRGGDQDRGSPARQPRHLRPGAGREGARIHRGRGCAGVAGA